MINYVRIKSSTYLYENLMKILIFFRTCLVTLICLVVWDVFRIILQAIIIHWMRRDRNETLVRYRQNITRSQNTNRSNNKIIMEKTSTVYSSGASLGVGLLGPWITKIAFNLFLKNHSIFWFRKSIMIIISIDDQSLTCNEK